MGFGNGPRKKDIKLYAKWIENIEPVPSPNPDPDSTPEEQEPESVVVTFNDISEHWAKEMIEELASQGIITGYPDGSFRPNEYIKRQHVALIFNRTFKFEPTREAISFSDVGPHHSYYEAVTTLQKAGIIDGANGAFHPEDWLTRAQMAKILVGALQMTPGGTSSFQDVSINDWSYDYIAALEQAGIALGTNGKFKPNEPVTRAQLVAFLSRAMEYLEREIE